MPAPVAAGVPAFSEWFDRVLLRIWQGGRGACVTAADGGEAMTTARARAGPARSAHRRWIGDAGLTAGTLGSTAAQTVMVAVFPLLLAEHAGSAFRVGLVLAGEGALALAVPYWVGLLSDRLPNSLADRFGRRLFFLLLTAPLMAASIAIVPFLSGYWQLAGAAFVFFAALHAYLTPLWAMMLDAVPEERWGRVQGVRGAFHAAGLAYGLIGGGLLYSIWRPLPFVFAAALVLGATALTCVAARARGQNRDTENAGGAGWADLKRNRPARWFLIGNALWTGGVDGLRPYFFLFAAAVIGITVAQTSLLLILLVVGLGLGSLLLGYLADRVERTRLLWTGLLITGIAMLAGVFVRDLETALPLLLVAGAGAAAVMTLPFTVYAEMVPDESMGRNTGLYVISLGAGRMIAPVLVGAAIDLAAPLFPDHDGYPAMWPVAGLLMLSGAAALSHSLRARR
jgi:MFS family permease